jgi:hypothetical protein
MRDEDHAIFFWFEFSAFFLWAWMLQRLQFVTHWMAQDLTHTGRLLFLFHKGGSTWLHWDGAVFNINWRLTEKMAR